MNYMSVRVPGCHGGGPFYRRLVVEPHHVFNSFLGVLPRLGLMDYYKLNDWRRVDGAIWFLRRYSRTESARRVEATDSSTSTCC